MSWVIYVQVREFLHDALYETEGYFSRQEAPVGRLLRLFPFNEMHGHREYSSALRQRYDELQVALPTESCPLFRFSEFVQIFSEFVQSIDHAGCCR